MSEKINHCYDARSVIRGIAPEVKDTSDCPGRLYAGWHRGYAEGYYVEVCPRRSALGSLATHIEFCGNGPDVLVLHRDNIPTEDEIVAETKAADSNW